MWPNASMMPSLARMRLATASSWRSSANGSGMDVSSVWQRVVMPAKGGIRQSPASAMMHERTKSDFWIAGSSPFADDGHRGKRQPASASRAADPAENLREFFLHLLRELRARARDHWKVL